MTLKQAVERFRIQADYYIAGLQAVQRKSVVRDLDERHVTYDNARNELLAWTGCEKHGVPFISPGLCAFCDEDARTLLLDGDVVERATEADFEAVAGLVAHGEQFNPPAAYIHSHLFAPLRRIIATAKAATRSGDGELLDLLKRVTDAAENLAGELTDPGTEALAAIHCARAALSSRRGE